MSFLRPKVNVTTPPIPEAPPAPPVKPITPMAADEVAKSVSDPKKVNKGTAIKTSPKGVMEEAPLAFASLLSTADIKMMKNFLTNGKSSKS